MKCILCLVVSEYKWYFRINKHSWASSIILALKTRKRRL